MEEGALEMGSEAHTEPASGRLAFLKASHTQGQSYKKGLLIWWEDSWVELPQPKVARTWSE